MFHVKAYLPVNESFGKFPLILFPKQIINDEILVFQTIRGFHRRFFNHWWLLDVWICTFQNWKSFRIFFMIFNVLRIFFQVSPLIWGQILEVKLSLNVCLTIGKWCKAIPWKNPANLSKSSKIARRGRDWKKDFLTCPHIWTNCKMLLIETNYIYGYSKHLPFFYRTFSFIMFRIFR